MELEELRQRLLLRSKSSEIPPIAHPVQISDVALSQAASKLKWETTLSPAELSARLGINGGKAETVAVKSENENAKRAENTTDALPSADAASPNHPEANGASPVAASTAAPAEPISMLANTVDKLSEPTEAFREHFAHLSTLLGPIESATQSTEEALLRVAGLFEHLSNLANSFQSVKAFAEQVKTLSVSFEPMKGLNAQLDLVMQALYANVKEAGAALAPVKTFQGKLRHLMSALDSVDKLEGQISGLAETFRPAAEPGAQALKVAAAEKPAAVAQAA